MTIKSALPRDSMVTDHRELCLALGGDETSFTGGLLRLIAKADPGNLHRLSQGFPGHVVAFLTWRAAAPDITAGELADMANAAEERIPV